ncbi:MAG: phenylalanine--tRNA ligase subunit beta [Bacteroidota bacterium]
MKISLNWLKDYLDIPLNAEQTSELLTDIGLEVEGMEATESIKGGLEGVLIGHVLECGQHPNADRLSLTKVDVGGAEPLQIVCGAPNVAQGQTVVVATVGTTLHNIEGESMKIKKGKIRGEVSEGMICAEDELGLGRSHDGIIVLAEQVPVGTPAREYFKVETDIIYEIGLTPNRSDATSHIGVARDLAAALKINHQHSGQLNWPNVDHFAVDNHDLPVEVVIENTEACPRYSGVSIKGIKVGGSPDWLKNRLNAIGVRPINNIVDITNFVLHELGQPLHAFDADKIAGHKVIVKTLPEGSLFHSLDEAERKLSSEDLMICDGDSKGMCIAGVFGGIDSGVTDRTTNIFLESAHFDARWVRRTSTRHLLRTDAAMCYEKGSDPSITVYALKRAVLLFKELAGGEIASEIVDVYPQEIERPQVEVSYTNINRLIGVQIPAEKVKEILAALDLQVLEENAEGLRLSVPTSKVDVLREADVIEEILRIYGLNNVPISNKISSTIGQDLAAAQRKAKAEVSSLLTGNGFHEMMAVSLTQSRYFKEILPVADEELVYVANTSNVHLDVMRPVVLFGGLEAILRNQNRRNADLRLYEWGNSYRKQEEGYEEQAHLCLYISGRRWAESWLSKEAQEVDFYTLKALVENITRRLGLSGYQTAAISTAEDQRWTYGTKYHRGPVELVSFGKLASGVLHKMEIKRAVYYADFNWGNILKATRKNKIDFVELTKFPSIRRDLAIVIDNSINFSDIANIARKTGKKILKNINLFDVYENEQQIGKDKKSYSVSFIFEDPSKTLKDKEVDKIMNQLIQNYEGKLGALIRR